MKRLALLAILATVLVGCDGLDPEEPWEGEPDRFEPDDDKFMAREQRVNARQVRHTFASNTIDPDEDWVRVRVTEPDLVKDDGVGPLYRFASIAVAGTPMIELWKEHGGKYMGPNTGYSPFFYMQTPGVYFMKFYESSGAGGEYDSYFRLWKDSGGADVAVTTLIVPREIAAGGTADLDVTVVNQGNEDATGVVLKVYVTSKRRVDGEFDIASHSVGDVAAGDMMDITIPDVSFPVSPTAGVYVIVKSVFADSYPSNDFCVSSTLLGVDTGDDWEVDLDNAVETVVRAPVVLETPEAHTFFPAADVDVVPLAIGSGEDAYYEVWTSNIRGEVNTRIEILDDLGVPIAADANASGNGLESGASWVCKGLAEGNYFIWVDEVADLTGAYDLTVRKSELPAGPDLLEFDDDLDTQDDVWPWHAMPIPNDLGTPSELPRSFHHSDDVDWVVYSVPTRAPSGVGDPPASFHNMDHLIRTINPDGVVPMYELYQADGDKLPVDGASVYTDTTIDCVLPAGLYYIRIVDAAGAVGSYKIEATVTAP